MKRKVAVEDGLSNVVQELKREGYEVVNLEDDRSLGDIDAYVITGEDENVMNIQNITTQAPVISARGMSAREVKDQVAEHIKRKR